MFELNKKNIRRLLLVALSCIFFYWLLHETERVAAVFSVIKKIAAPFVAGATVAFILNVPMRAFENLLKGIKNNTLRRVVAIVLTLIALLLVLALVFWLLIPELVETIQSLIPTLETFGKDMVQKAIVFVQDHPEMQEWFGTLDLQSLNIGTLVQKLLSWMGSSLEKIITGTFTTIGIVASALMNILIAVVFAIYCLFQKENLARQGRKLLYAFLPEKKSDWVIHTLRLTNSTFANFLSGQCVEVCILGVMFAVSMAILRMPYIPLISVMIAVTAFIPIVGAWVGCAFGAFLILVANPPQALLFVILFVVLQEIENNLIYPKVVGTSIGLSGMWVLVAIAVGGELFGVIGMFLMIPMTSVIQTVLREFTAARLANNDVVPEKLEPQPPEIRSKFTPKKKKVKVKEQKASAEKKKD